MTKPGGQPLSPVRSASQRYELSFWQESTTYVYAYVIETLSNGTTQAVSLMSTGKRRNIREITPTWSEYQDNFVTPSKTASLQIVLATSGEGMVSLSDVALTPLGEPNAGYL